MDMYVQDELRMVWRSMLLGLAVVGIPLYATAADMPEGDTSSGQAMFESVCSHCHNMSYDDKFGPGLKGIMERVDEAWLDRWLVNPAAMIKTDGYAKSLHESNAYGMNMPSIPAMQDAKNRADMIAYLKTL